MLTRRQWNEKYMRGNPCRKCLSPTVCDDCWTDIEEMLYLEYARRNVIPSLSRNQIDITPLASMKGDGGVGIPTREDPQMGMFDAPQYLTGSTNGFVEPGDTFWLHNARVDGTVNINGQQREQVKLRVSHERAGETINVFSSGAGIVNQIKRMDENDRKAFPMQVRIDQLPSKQGNPTNVLTPADQPAPSTGVADEPADF